jgi:hypothetical protein
VRVCACVCVRVSVMVCSPAYLTTLASPSVRCRFVDADGNGRISLAELTQALLS